MKEIPRPRIKGNLGGGGGSEGVELAGRLHSLDFLLVLLEFLPQLRNLVPLGLPRLELVHVRVLGLLGLELLDLRRPGSCHTHIAIAGLGPLRVSGNRDETLLVRSIRQLLEPLLFLLNSKSVNKCARRWMNRGRRTSSCFSSNSFSARSTAAFSFSLAGLFFLYSASHSKPTQNKSTVTS